MSSMESNINFTEISKYSKSFADSAIDHFFENKSNINGEEILNFTPVQQVNLFIIYELLNLWKEENRKLESPYFDYSSSEVQEALKKLMNSLSRNIRIKSEDLKPLLLNATEKALLLIFSPYQFYKNEIDRPEKAKLKFAQLEELKKYVKVNKHLLIHYIDRLNAENIEEIFNDDAIRIFDEVCENMKESPDDFESFIPQFSKVAPLNINLFYRESEEGQIHSKHYEEQEGDVVVPEINSLNETWHKEVETLADIHEKRQIDGIRKNITINQRFMFVNELFEGNADEFESVVNFLDNCDKKADAIGFIEANCIEAKGWDRTTEEVQEFILIINKRFPEH